MLTRVQTSSCGAGGGHSKRLCSARHHVAVISLCLEDTGAKLLGIHPLLGGQFCIARVIELVARGEHRGLKAALRYLRDLPVELKTQSPRLKRHAAKDMVVKALDINFDERGDAVAMRQLIECEDVDLDGFLPMSVMMLQWRGFGCIVPLRRHRGEAGYSTQMCNFSLPGLSPTAQFSTLMLRERASCCRVWQQLGFGSIATTVAPRLVKHSAYLPKWAPTSNTRSPRRTKGA